MIKTIFLYWVLMFTGTSLVYAQEQNHDHDEEMTREISVQSSADDHNDKDDDHKEHADDHGDHDDEHMTKEDSHDDHDGHEEESNDAELSIEQRRAAGIKTMIAKHQSLGEAVTAPGEVTLNAYRSTKVTPRIAAQVMKRHVHLGDHVKKGQPLVTLSSVEMAEAQGALMEASVELRRVKKLGRKVVSEKRFVAAHISFQQAYARVQAYGMTDLQIKKLLKQNDAKATGEFVLVSSQTGTVINDDFILGEIVEPGHVLFDVSDESLLWVEARLTPEAAGNIAIGAPARVRVGKKWLTGKVIQSRHTLDETTRTLALHVEVANTDDTLHPGQFVTVVIEGKNKQEGIVVPLEAVLRGADGDWQVFVQTAPNRFEPQEVDVLYSVGNQAMIQGIKEGTSLVSQGAFFVQSEIAKSGFEVHNH
ncbi:MAG: efflux RND transporter periplasmic adaptor subunit [Gammaproteobacteria bacterium]|nr:efflux RND transporter periplasmic adaptor subunit [Gammaproteobacteria bacterium]